MQFLLHPIKATPKQNKYECVSTKSMTFLKHKSNMYVFAHNSMKKFKKVTPLIAFSVWNYLGAGPVLTRFLSWLLSWNPLFGQFRARHGFEPISFHKSFLVNLILTTLWAGSLLKHFLSQLLSCKSLFGHFVSRDTFEPFPSQKSFINNHLFAHLANLWKNTIRRYQMCKII